MTKPRKLARLAKLLEHGAYKDAVAYREKHGITNRVAAVDVGTYTDDTKTLIYLIRHRLVKRVDSDIILHHARIDESIIPLYYNNGGVVGTVNDVIDLLDEGNERLATSLINMCYIFFNRPLKVNVLNLIEYHMDYDTIDDVAHAIIGVMDVEAMKIIDANQKRYPRLIAEFRDVPVGYMGDHTQMYGRRCMCGDSGDDDPRIQSDVITFVQLVLKMCKPWKNVYSMTMKYPMITRALCALRYPLLSSDNPQEYLDGHWIGWTRNMDAALCMANHGLITNYMAYRLAVVKAVSDGKLPAIPAFMLTDSDKVDIIEPMMEWMRVTRSIRLCNPRISTLADVVIISVGDDE